MPVLPAARLIDVDCLSPSTLLALIEHGEQLQQQNPTELPSLNGALAINLFFEQSTRTRTSFEIAVKRLGGEILNFDTQSSSLSKGETLQDTLMTLEAASGGAIFLVRHHQSGSAHFMANHLSNKSALVNAGDGWHAHPTQAIGDLLTIKQHLQSLKQAKLLIVGDILHSRVARSLAKAARMLGLPKVKVCAPPNLLPRLPESLDMEVTPQLEPALHEVDVCIALRLQSERMQTSRLPSAAEYFRFWGLRTPMIKRVQAARESNKQLPLLIMHPGPINRGKDISSAVADGKNSAILKQVANAVAVRMAILLHLQKIRDTQ